MTRNAENKNIKSHVYKQEEATTNLYKKELKKSE